MKCFLTFFIIYWASGMLLLPEGEFSRLNDIAVQYKNCIKNEDKDMTYLDFITDHIINVDCLFNRHQDGDKQKPHKALNLNHHTNFSHYISCYKFSKLEKKVCVELINTHISDYNNNYYFRFSSGIFRPPLC